MGHPKQFTTYKQTDNTIDSTAVVLCIAITDTASTGNDGAGVVDCDYRRAVGPTKIIRGVLWTQLNRLERLVVLTSLRERSFYVLASRYNFFSSSGFR